MEEDLPSWLLTQTAAHASRMVGERFLQVGARGYHYRLLRALLRWGETSQAELGRRTGIHLSDLVAALNEMQEAGYIRRRPNPDDRRRNIISITDPGRERYRQLSRQVQVIQDELLEPLDQREREQLTVLLRKLYDHHLGQGFPPLSKM
jgi:DNA-binding MarR family transcriptional regulator